MYSIVITAAGSGSRAGLGYNKMLYKIDGITLLEKSVQIFANNNLFNELIVTASQVDYPLYTEILKNYNVKLVIGGKERMNSVYQGVLEATNNTVFIHDGARVYLDNALIDRLSSYDQAYDGLALATPVVDTTLLVEDNQIKQILNRDKLFNMQTPQVVNRNKYLEAYGQAITEEALFTDEMSLLTNYGYNCHIVKSEGYNKKLTNPEDF